MNDGVLSPDDVKTGMGSLLRLGTMAPPTTSGPAHTPDAEDDVSVAGVLLLSAMSMLMAIMAMVTFALFVIGCWWLISHVPVPAGVHALLAKVHLARQ